ATGALGEDLSGAVVVRHWNALRTPHQAAILIVDGDDRLLHHDAVAEGNHSCARLEASIHDETGNQSGWERSDITDELPDHPGRGGSHDLLPDGGHQLTPFQDLALRPVRLQRGTKRLP